MFTGIIETVGKVVEIRHERRGSTLYIESEFLSEPLKIGESIAVSGVCLTVEKIMPRGFTVFASPETITRTTLGKIKASSMVNLERALPSNGRFGGHIVLGHVDAVTKVVRVVPVGGAREITFISPDDVRRFLAPKGSIAIDGVSLTINYVYGGEFSVMVIPHTLEVTTLKHLRPGSEVNIEADCIARYVWSMINPLLPFERRPVSKEILDALNELDEE